MSTCIFNTTFETKELVMPEFQADITVFYNNTRASVARVANSYHDIKSRHDKKSISKFGKYIYHRYIYISRPPRERNRQIDVQIAN